MRAGFSKISHSIFNVGLKPIDLVVYIFYQSHYGGFIPSLKYTRRALGIHLHTLKISQERIRLALAQKPLDKTRGFFFVPHCIFDFKFSRAQMAILIYAYSQKAEITPSIIELRKVFGLSYSTIQKSLNALEKQEVFYQRDLFVEPKIIKVQVNHHTLVKSELEAVQNNKTLVEYENIVAYYEYLRYKIGEHYQQNWEKQEVTEWKIAEAQDILKHTDISLKDIKGILGYKALVLLYDMDTAIKMFGAFTLRILFSAKHIQKNFFFFQQYKQNRDFQLDNWYINTHLFLKK